MKKSFPFEAPGHKPARVVDSIKSDVRKYIKRERRKSLPEGVDFWDFDCKVGHGDQAPVVKHVAELSEAIDEVVKAECDSVYIEILAKPGHRTKKDKPSSPSDR